MPYSEVIQAVRRYRPSDLLPYLAAHSASLERATEQQDQGRWFPWAIATLAKESVLRGNEFRSLNIDGPGLAQLVRRFNASDHIGPGRTAAAMLTPILYEQFPYQESVFEEMARAHALLVHTEPGEEDIPWGELLGMSLDSAMRASHVLHSWVVSGGGRYEPEILDRPDFGEIFERVAPRSEIEATAELLRADIPELRRARAFADAKAAVPEALERYGFNPLKSRPLVDLGADGIWAPQTMLVARAFLGTNLYYRGLDAWGRPFADKLGDRTERYVGRQLSLLDGITLHPEIPYAKGKKSIDWIWVSEAAVILVECKAARLTLDAQAGGSTLAGVMERYLGAARAQIDKTADLIRNNHQAFEHIPKDRPIVGVVTTTEPFYLAGTPFQGFASSGVVPVTNLSLRDLEVLVTLPEPEAAALVVEHAHPTGEGGRFAGAFDEETRKRKNPILAEAWTHFDFLDPSIE